jgi:hypothetical protein
MSIWINQKEYEVSADLFPGYDLERLARWFNINRPNQDLQEFVQFWQNKISSVDSNFTEIIVL